MQNAKVVDIRSHNRGRIVIDEPDLSKRGIIDNVKFMKKMYFGKNSQDRLLGAYELATLCLDVSIKDLMQMLR